MFSFASYLKPTVSRLAAFRVHVPPGLRVAKEEVPPDPPWVDDADTIWEWVYGPQVLDDARPLSDGGTADASETILPKRPKDVRR